MTTQPQTSVLDTPPSTNGHTTPQLSNGATPQRVTLEEYWAVYYHDLDHTYEYNDGVLEEKPVAKRVHADMFLWFAALLRRYFEVKPVAYVSALEMGFEMRVLGKKQVRRPDLGIVLHTNAVPFEADDHNYNGIFDVCIEFVSDSSRREIERDTVHKFNEYEAAGVPEYWLLSHNAEILSFYRLNRWGNYEPVPLTADGVWASRVLPGFQLRRQDLLDLPSFADLIDDPVYAAFIFPEYHEERARAAQNEELLTHVLELVEQKHQQAEQERQRAELAEQERHQAEQQIEQERQRAELAEQQIEQERRTTEKLLRLLREQGIDPDTI